jgi:hypothetical protein
MDKMKGEMKVYMKPLRLCLLALPLTLAACNPNSARAQRDFNAAGNNLGHANLGSGFNDIGKGFSDGANATGDAIVQSAHAVGNSFSR